MNHWYVIETKARSEPEVHQALTQLGLTSYFPTYGRQTVDRSKHARPQVEVRVPLFPRYIFAQFDTSADLKWVGISRLKGVIRLLGNPSPIRGDFISQIQTELMAIAAAQIADKAITFEPIEKGARVKITAGPFATYGGSLVRMASADRVRIMLDAVGHPVLDVERSAVVRA